MSEASINETVNTPEVPTGLEGLQGEHTEKIHQADNIVDGEGAGDPVGGGR